MDRRSFLSLVGAAAVGALVAPAACQPGPVPVRHERFLESPEYPTSLTKLIEEYQRQAMEQMRLSVDRIIFAEVVRHG